MIVSIKKYEQVRKDDGYLIIAIDEFGKFLEYASRHNPENEMYFIQQLAEFVNESSRKIILLTSVHQAIDSYATSLTDSQKNEWKKVKGRLTEITFNEPIEQLLLLASRYLSNVYDAPTAYKSYNQNLCDLNIRNHCFSLSKSYLNSIGSQLFPLDIFSAIVLTKSLQRYGQNERSLFTFLNTSDHLGLYSLGKNEIFDLPQLYNYLFVNLYSTIVSKHNPDYSQWALIKDSIERAEAMVDGNQTIAISLIKIIGLLGIFSSKGASINSVLLTTYLSYNFNSTNIALTLDALTRLKIIRFSSFSKSYKLFGGTDMDIEDAILRASSVEEYIDIVPKLKDAFSFPIVTAKKVSYKTGTPRLFEFEISESPIIKVPKNEIDGFINLIFNENLIESDLISKTSNVNPILYGLYKNSSTVKNTLLDISRTQRVLCDVDSNDKFAIAELKIIIESQTSLLNHYVLDSLYSKNIEWYFQGERQDIRNKQGLNKVLSEICSTVYKSTPVINMELINKHKVSVAINSARKSYFKRLVNNWAEKDLGYPEDKFPSDKTIYLSLIKKFNIHRLEEGFFILGEPQSEDANFMKVWLECELFLNEAKKEQKQITELIDTLTQKPFKLKQGVIDFLIPTFLFVKRGDFALYNIDGGYMPYLNETILYLMTRNPHEYAVKSFELDNLRLSLFNKYRSYLNQDAENSLSNESFIESVRPFLMLYKGLTEYSTTTKRLSQEAIKVRTAISSAKDPEKIFFEQFPLALGYSIKQLIANEQLFDEYIIQFQKTILEVKNSYNELLTRVEYFLTKDVLGQPNEFPNYKSQLQKRFSSLKDHQVLPSQKMFLLRVNSALDDRDSWLNSICFALLSKPLDRISDRDEDILKDKLQFTIKELDNLCDINRVSFVEEEEKVYKVDFTTQSHGLKNYVVRVSKLHEALIQKSMNKISGNLSENKQIRIAVLAELLKNELNE